MTRPELPRIRSLWISVRASAVALAIAVTSLLILSAVPLAQAQTIDVLHSFTCCSQGYLPLAGLTMDKAGSLYGTTSTGGLSYGGGRCCGTVFKLTRKGSGWIFTPLYSFVGGSDGDNPAAPLVIGPDGSLYGTTLYGGSRTYCDSGNGCGTVFKLSPPATACKTALCGWKETVLYSFTGGNDGGEPGYGPLVFDQAGNLYGTTITGGVGSCSSPAQTCGVVYKLTPSNGSWTESVLYSFQGGSDGGNPYAGLIFDEAGNLYGATAVGGSGCNGYGCGTVFRLTPSGSGWTKNVLYTFQGSSDGLNPYGGLIFDGSGNLYGTTAGGGSGSGGTAFMLAPSNGNWKYSLVYSFAGSVTLPGPYDSLLMDTAGSLYGTTCCDGSASQGSVFKLTASNGGWTETDLYDFDCSDGCYPHGSVVLDANENLYATAELGGVGNGGVVFEITP